VEQVSAEAPTPAPPIQPVCPIGYNQSYQRFEGDQFTKNLEGDGGFEERMAACKDDCDNRDKCTGFSNWADSTVKWCLTFSGGTVNEAVPDKWINCANTQ